MHHGKSGFHLIPTCCGRRHKLLNVQFLSIDERLLPVHLSLDESCSIYPIWDTQSFSIELS